MPAMDNGRSQMRTSQTAALTMVLSVIGGNLMFQDSPAAGAESDWALEQLHKPSPSLREIERRGRVTIHDGINLADVDDAMDRQFDRIESMMFIRTVYPAPDGTFEVESDCD